MVLTSSCDCGQQLRTSAPGGEQVSCPKCGKTVLIRPGAPAKTPSKARAAPPPAGITRTPRPAPRKPAEPEVVELPDEPEPDEDEGRPAAPKRKKKKKKRWRVGIPSFSLLGIHLSARAWVGFAFLFTVLGTVVYLIVPGTRVKVHEVKRVDVFTALHVRQRNVMEVVKKRKDDQAQLFLGGRPYLVVRDSPEGGESILIQVSFSSRALSDNAYAGHGTFVVSAGSFKLRVGSGEPVSPVFLENEYGHATKSLVVGLGPLGAGSADQILPRHLPPWTHAGEVLRPDVKVAEVGDDPALMEKVVIPQGEALFKGKRGMEVRYRYLGGGIEVSWDPQSQGWLSVEQHECLDRFMFERLYVTCVFPRPEGSGKATLSIWDKDVDTFTLP